MSVYVALRRLMPAVVVTWFVTGVEVSRWEWSLRSKSVVTALAMSAYRLVRARGVGSVHAIRLLNVSSRATGQPLSG
jgi:hypothetical protein